MAARGALTLLAALLGTALGGQVPKQTYVGEMMKITLVCGSNVDTDAYHRWAGAAPFDTA